MSAFGGKADTSIVGGYKTSDGSNWRKARCFPLLSGSPMKMRTAAITTNDSPINRCVFVFMGLFPAPVW
jgi:hypothetical protein